MENILMTDNERRKSLVKDLTSTFGKSTDIDIKSGVQQFMDNGGYDTTKPYSENKKDCIRFIAVRAAMI